MKGIAGLVAKRNLLNELLLKQSESEKVQNQVCVDLYQRYER